MLAALPINGQTWLICGGRNYDDAQTFNEAMAHISGRFGLPTIVVNGGALGADTMASQWAERLALRLEIMTADWEKHGRAAGPIRNQKMLDEYEPHYVIAFPGGRGTSDMVQRAKKSGIEVIEIKAT